MCLQILHPFLILSLKHSKNQTLFNSQKQMTSSELQIWNNAAFDSGEFENRKVSFVLDQSSKENRSPIPVKTPATTKPTGNSFKIPNLKLQETEEIRDERKIDSEMEEIKKEITRLGSRLEALRQEKAELKIKGLEKLGRMVPAKFKEQKQGIKKVEESSSKVRLSLGPSEIRGGFRRGVSLGPAEIYSRQLGKQETTLTPANRRKSCFFKLDDVDEEKTAVTVESKPRRKTPVPRQAATTVGLKKDASRTMGLSSSSSSSCSIQPKKLFKTMPGRVVASRYNQSISVSKSAIRKRSLPENDGNSGESLRPEKGTTRKKRWEIPSEIVMIQGGRTVFDETSPRAILMPKRIKTVRRSGIETPRDSGPAKRVVDLVGRKSFFQDDELTVHRRMLSFGEEEEEDEK